MMTVINSHFFAIGFGLLVLAMRLGMVGSNVRRAETPAVYKRPGRKGKIYIGSNVRRAQTPAVSINDLIIRGKFIVVIGLVIVSMGLLRWQSNTAEGYVMVTAGGAAVMLLGISWWLQGLNDFKKVWVGTWVTVVLGIAFIFGTWLTIILGGTLSFVYVLAEYIRSRLGRI